MSKFRKSRSLNIRTVLARAGGPCHERISFRRWLLVFALAWIPVAPVQAAEDPSGTLQDYDSKYYAIHTDIDPEDAKEAVIRMTKMAEEYHERTRSFAGTIRTKLPFFLFKSPQDYYDHGGLPHTAGVFIEDEFGGRLLAIAGQRTTLNTWHTVQHEGFHQFAHAVIGGRIPAWLDEGLAEYFGESIFTGDSFVTGVVPPWRLQRLKRELDSDRLKSVRDIMRVSSQQWLTEMNIRDYDQAWSMVHYLVHGEHGKYQTAFSDCIRQMSQGRDFDMAWQDSLGPVDRFQDRWKQYWLSQPQSPTTELYAKAAVATLTSFLARATAQRQSFANYQEFRTSAAADDLHINPDDWLPHSLIGDTLRVINPDDPPELHPGPDKLPIITLTLPDATVLTGSFTLHHFRVDQVRVEIDELPRILKEATTLLAKGGKKGDARIMVQAALKENPASPTAADAKKFLQSVR